jgi:major vault protein
VIKGSDVSFYIPCTGVEVVKDENNKYVREAVTLEQLEYCCLIDESGKKEYPRGPAVVFPKPTQQFEADRKQRRKFRPLELNQINGIHLKVTASFSGPDIENDPSKQRDFREGEELFVTGKTLPLYYPREELSIIEYGQGNKKHYSTAVPKGEGRYVIQRETGDIKLVRGPMMLLPDPRHEILVRRVLSDDECELMYPGNQTVLEYNRELREAMASSPSGRSGVVSEGDFRKRQALQAKAQGGASHRNLIGGGFESQTLGATADFSAQDDWEPEEAGEQGGAANSIARGTKYTQPRQLQLNTKMDGAVRVEVWPGYAVLVVGSEGQRRVEEGPVVLLLDYDEKLGFMKLSTGKPKTTDKLYKTSYLCVQNNQVGDIVPFESKDHVKGAVKISLRVNFEAISPEDRLKWFSVDNYVKYLCDHVRSILAGMAKRHTVAEIKANYVTLVREAILGVKPTASSEASQPLRSERPGLVFQSNGMRVIEVEVLDLSLADAQISKLLDQAQHQVVQTNIEIEAARKSLEATKEKERISQETERVSHETIKLKTKLQQEAIEEQIGLMLAQVDMELQKLGGDKKKNESKQDIEDLVNSRALARAKAETEHLVEVDRAKLELRKDELDATTKAAVDRFTAAKDGLYEVLVSLGRDETAAKLAEACTVERYLSGDSMQSSVANLLSMFPMLKGFMDKATAIQGDGNGNRPNRLKSPETLATK